MRTVIKDEIFNEMLGDILPQAAKAAEFVYGAEWLLIRFPEYGTRLSAASEVWFLPLADEISDTPPLGLYYSFDQTYVWFLGIVLS